jgi:predicted dehydrogenase
VVGCGWFACEAHIPALLRLEREGFVEVVALCSRSEESLSRASQQFGLRTLRHYKQLDRVLADPSIDLLDLVLPIGQMPEAIRASVRAGKHVISEKPCAPSVATCLDLLNEHSRLDNPPFWAVAENWRFKSSTKIVEEIVRTGRLGSVHLADFRFVTSASPSFYLGWRGSPDYPGGYLLDSGVHFVALLRQVVGEIEHVSAVVSQHRPHLPPADSVTAVMTFANGAQGSFQLSFAASPRDARPATLTLVASNGSLSADFFSGLIRLSDAAQEQLIKVPDDPWVQGGVYGTLAHCLEALRHDAPLRSSFSEGLRDVAVIEAMLISSRSGKPIAPRSLYPALHGGPRKIATFNGVWRFNPKHVVDCGSIPEVCSAVKEAVSAGLRIRTMGMANSWASELLTSDVCIGLRRLNRIHRVDVTRRTALVEAGVRLGDLNRVLAAHGLCLPSLPFNPNVTVGGAVSTATHRTSPNWGTLSDFVASLKLIPPSGDIKELGPASPPEELRAARAAVGMLGVIVEVEFEATAMPFVRLTNLRMDLPTFLGEMPTLLSRYEHLWAHWILGENSVQIECLESRPQPDKDFHPYVIGDSGSWASLRTSPPASSFLTVTKGESRQVWMSVQYGLALSQIGMAIDRIRASNFAQTYAGRIVEMKFLKASDRTFLGFNCGHDSVLFNIWWMVDESMRYDVFSSFESTMRELRARPHWGKFHRLPGPGYLKEAYSLWGEFEEVRSRFDPSGTFSIFPGTDGPRTTASRSDKSGGGRRAVRKPS